MNDRQELKPSQDHAPGIFDSVKRVLATLAGIAQTRVELLATEVEEQVAHLGSLLLWAIVALFLGFTAAILLAVAILIAFWDSNRILAALLLAAAFGGLGFLSVLRVKSLARKRPHLFETTLEELAKDRDHLGGA